MGQRDVMRRLWREFGPDKERVVREYVAAESAGLAPRAADPLSLSASEYARRLLADGLDKGWLDAPELSMPGAKSSSQPGPTPSTIPSPPRPGKTKEEWAAAAAAALGATPESAEYLRRVEKWRAAWRPERVRVLLVAESHVAEQPGDLHISVSVPTALGAPPGLPEGFCRLVYCLGYGEDALCLPVSPANNGGTWQFWDLFGAVAARYEPVLAPAMPRRHQSDLAGRILWKLSILGALRTAGVWLEDASVVALYSSGGRRLASGAAYARVVRDSFEAFVWSGVAEDDPEQVWVIGRGVGRALHGLPMIRDDRVISQPQDRDAARRAADLRHLLGSLPG